MKKSILLCLVTILIMGSSVHAGLDSLRVATVNLGEGDCTHLQKEYQNVGVKHTVKCIYCQENLGEEAHVDLNSDMCCDACLESISSLAPSEGAGYVESEITLNQSVKVSIVANKDEASKVIVSSWYGTDSDVVYAVEAIYNKETNHYETIINFSDINGAYGTYSFDATIYDESGNMRYVRISSVEYTENGIVNVAATRNADGDIEVSIEAIDGGYVYISTNGEAPTDDSNWQEYNRDETYIVEDENVEVSAISVYYRSSEEIMVAADDGTTVTVAEMITEWTIPANNTEILLPVTGTVDITVNWGDGNVEKITGNYTSENLPSHTYEVADTYEIKISGTCTKWGTRENYSTDDAPTDSPFYTYRQYLTGLKHWGELGSTSYGFSFCKNLKYILGNATQNTFENMNTMDHMFANCTSLTSIDTSNFNTSKVKSMYGAFHDCTALTNLDVSSFDTSKVTIMQSMFNGCSSLKALDLSDFDTSNVTTMYLMFNECSALTTLNVSNFDISNVTKVNGMFYECSALTDLDLSDFKTNKVTTTDTMFYGCTALKSLDISNFDTSKVTLMTSMFYGCSSLTSLDLSSFDTSSVTNMNNMFYRCALLKSILVGNEFIVNAGTTVTDIFEGAYVLSAIIVTDEITMQDQFASIADKISNITFYVKNETIEDYKLKWSIDDSKIKPILELKGESSYLLVDSQKYEEPGYKIAGFDEFTKEELYGYEVTASGAVYSSVVGTYQMKYSLKRTSKTENDISTIIRKIVVAPEVEIEIIQDGEEYNGKWTNKQLTIKPIYEGNINITAYRYKKPSDTNWSEIVDKIVLNENMNSEIIVQGINPEGVVVTNELKSNTIKIDKVLPEITAITSKTEERTLTLNVVANDDFSGLMDYSIALDEASTKNWKHIINTDEINIDVLGSGTYYICVKDNAGNISTTKTINAIKDTTAPTGEITLERVSNRVGNTGYTTQTSVKAIITASDDNTATEELQMAIFNKAEYEALTNEEEITWMPFASEKQITVDEEKNHEEMHVLLKDKAGNISTPINKELGRNVKYKVYHYIKNLTGTGYTKYKEEEKMSIAGRTVTLENERRRIDGTTYEKGSVTANGNAVNTIKIKADGSTEIYLYYTRNTYILTLDKNNNINSVTGAGRYQFGETINISATFANVDGYEYTFEEWKSNITGLLEHQKAANKAITMPAGNITLKAVAKAKANKYNITLNTNGGTVEQGIVEIKGSTTYGILPTPERVGYTFEGWYTELNGGQKVESTTTLITLGNHTLYAKWTITKYTITYDLVGGTNPTNAISEYTIESSVTLPIPTRIGHTFAGWYEDTEYTGAAETMIQKGTIENKRYYAKWVANNYKYNIVYKSTTGITIDTDEITRPYGTSEIITPKTISGYLSTSPQSVTWDSVTAKTITFEYTPFVYLISGVGEENPSTYTVETETFTLVNPTKEGYIFEGWSEEGVATIQKTVTITKGSTGNRYYTQNWTPIN